MGSGSGAVSGAGLAWWVGAFEAVSCLARCYVTVPLPCKPPAMGPTHLRGSYRADLRHRCALLLPCTSCLWAVVSFAMKVTALPPLLVAGCAARQSLHAPAARPAAPPPMLADAAAAALLASALPALPPVPADALCHCTPCTGAGSFCACEGTCCARAACFMFGGAVSLNLFLYLCLCVCLCM